MCESCVLPTLEVRSLPILKAPFLVVFCSNGDANYIDFPFFVGNLRSLNELAKKANADHILHTGDFGFYDDSSLERIADKSVFPSSSKTCCL